MRWSWPEIEPYPRALADHALTPANLAAWLGEWTALAERVHETLTRLRIATNLNTIDTEAEANFIHFLDEVYPRWQAAEQTLKEKLLASGLEPEGFALPLRNMRAEAALFREANLPLLVQEQKLVTEYDKVIGAQTVTWDGAEKTLSQLRPLYQHPDRADSQSNSGPADAAESDR